MKKIKNNNEFIISCVACIAIILVMCYFTFSSSTSSILKGTSAAATYGCLYDDTLVEGQNKCCQTGSTYIDGYCIPSTTTIYDGNYCTKLIETKWKYGIEIVGEDCGKDWTYVSADPNGKIETDEKDGTTIFSGTITCKSNSISQCGTKASNAYSSEQTFCFKCCFGGECQYSKGNYVNSSYYCRNVEMSNCNEPSTSYILSFNANNGSGTMENQQCEAEKACTINKNKFTRSCYTFGGWSGSDGKSYSDGASVTLTKDLTLTAKWNYVCGGTTTPTTYTITYNANGEGATGIPSNQTKTKGTAITLSKTEPARSGYTFLGWATSKSATSAEYQPGESYTKDSDITLYAIWKKDSTDGENPPSSSSSVPSSSSVSSSSSSNNNVTENAETGQIAIFVVWVIALGAICYSFYYFKKLNEN